MVTFCEQMVTISSILPTLDIYHIKEDDGEFNWTDKMIEGIFAGETKPLTFGDSWECPQGYQFVDENGNVVNAQKITLEKKEKMYPKTYEECCKVLGIPIHGGIALVGNWCIEDGYIVQHLETLRALSKLLICRDAYWKIAGEEMGLGKPWKPDWTDQESLKYCITSIKDQVEASKRYYIMNTILAFPTEEMRDTFYENFKELIESCKELL